jgi:hypothetical protein
MRMPGRPVRLILADEALSALIALESPHLRENIESVQRLDQSHLSPTFWAARRRLFDRRHGIQPPQVHSGVALAEPGADELVPDWGCGPRRAPGAHVDRLAYFVSGIKI